MFIDASAAVALIVDEKIARSIKGLIEQAPTQFYYSPLSCWEMCVAIARIYGRTNDAAQTIVEDWLSDLNAQCIDINHEILTGALAAHTKYGKGSGHPARLNMGDCFAYACAKSLKLPLLYVGDDFSHTDLALELK